MNYKLKVILLLISVALGWLLAGIGYTTPLGHPISTICFLLGLGLSFTSFVFLIITVNKR